MLRMQFKIRKSARITIRDIDAKNKIFKQELKDLGSQTEDKIKSVISSSKVRPQAGDPTTLEDTMYVEYFDNGVQYGWGVGKVDELNDKAPYWRAVNYGSSHMVGRRLPLGIFNPGEGKPSSENFRDGRWQEGGGYSPIVTRPIPPMNYLERTSEWLKSRVSALARVFRRG